MDYFKKIIKKFKKIISHSSLIKILFKLLLKIFIKIKDYFNYRQDIYNKIYLNDEEFIKKILTKESNSKNLDYSLIYNCLLDVKELKKIISLISIDSKDKIISFADKTCMHYFNLLGSGDVKVKYNLEATGFENIKFSSQINEDEINKIKLNIKNKVINYYSNLESYNYEPIDWQIDFKSGYRWDNNKWYKKSGIINPLGSDIKIPWELSRFNHLLMLGEAYLLTKNENYTKEFIFEITDWIINNPPGFGVDWLCTMDAAIRACNMIFSFSFFNDSNLITDEFKKEFIKNIYIHGIYIINNLENTYYVKNNHYLSDIVGLLYIGLFLNNTKIGKKWQKFSIKELKNQMQEQIYEDGTDFENSTCYHKLVLELFFYSTFFASSKKNTINNSKSIIESAIDIFGNQYIEKLKKMFIFLNAINNGNGKIPQIGDNDSGILHLFNTDGRTNSGYLIFMGAIFFNEEKLYFNKNKFYDETLWIFGYKAYEVYQLFNKRNTFGEKNSLSFKNGGFYILKNNDAMMIISAGKNGQNGIGGHTHNDKLSFIMSIEGEDIFIDSGTYIYTPLPDLRNKFRSTSSHNTVMVDKAEQNSFDEKDLFFLFNDSKVKVNKWFSSYNIDFFEGEHYGYLKLKEPLIHKRIIIFDKIKKYWIIKDKFINAGKHYYEINFILNNKLNLNENPKNSTITIKLNNKIVLNLIPIITNNNINYSIENCYVSDSYGEKHEAKKIKYYLNEKSPIEFSFIITYNQSDNFSIAEFEINELINNLSNA